MQVSVVIPTYRRPDLLDRCLAALAAQEFPAADCEILIADDAASEVTAEQVLRWSKRTPMPIRYLAVQGAHGPAAARNTGIREARGEIVAFTDDDTIPAPDWLREGIAAFTDDVAAVAGRVVMPLPMRPRDYERDAAGLAEADFVTANCFCRRNALQQIGGFDERFELAWREDSDLQFTLLEHGMKIARAPRALVLHPIRPAPWGVSLTQQRKSLFDALLYQKHPALYAQHIPGFPLPYLAMTGTGMLAAAGLMTGHRKAGLLFAAAYGLLAGSFCLKRLRGNDLSPAHLAEMAVTSPLIPPLSLYWRVRGALRFRTWFA